MPIEGSNYRRWEGKRTRTATRIGSIALSTFTSQIRSIPVIVVIVIFGLFVVGAGLLVVLGSLDAGDTTFVRDQNPDYNRTVVPQIEIDSITRHDVNGSQAVTLAPLSQGVGLSLGEWAVISLKVSNIGTGQGNVTVFFNPGSTAGIREQWFPLLIPANETDDMIALLKMGINIFDTGDGPDEGMGEEEKTRTRAKEDKPKFDGDDDSEGEEFSLFDQLIYGQGVPLNLSSQESASISVIVFMADDVLPDTLSLLVSAWADVEPDMKKVEDSGELWDYADGPANVISAVLPLNIVADPDVGPEVPLRDQIEVELVEISNSEKTWTKTDLQKPQETVKVTWDKEMTLKIKVTNTGPATRYVVAFYGMIEPTQEFSIDGLTTAQAQSQTMIPKGQSRVINLTFKPDRSFPEKQYQALLMLYVTETENNMSGSSSQDRIFEENEDIEVGEGLENIGERAVVLSHTVEIESKHYKKVDETADFFFFMFFTGGIPIPIIFLAVLAGSGLIANDRSHKTLSLYYSKAMPRYGYILGKFLGLSSLLFVATVVVSNLWFLIIMALGGFSLKFVLSHLIIMGQISLFGLIISLFLSAFVLAGSSLGKNKYMIGASVLALFLLFPVITMILSAITNYKKMVLISPTHNIQAVGLKIFGLKTPDVDWRLSALALGGVFAAAMGLLIFRLVIQEEVTQ